MFGFARADTAVDNGGDKFFIGSRHSSASIQRLGFYLAALAAAATTTRDSPSCSSQLHTGRRIPSPKAWLPSPAYR